MTPNQTFKSEVIQLSPRLVFRRITDPDEMAYVYHLRYLTFCVEAGIVDPSLFPGQIETDEYDANSLHFGLYQDEKLIAYGRMVLPCERFPIERSAELPFFEREHSVESSRVLVLKEHRNSDTVWHLFNGGYRFCQANNVTNMLSFSNQLMFNGYKKRGIPFDHIGQSVDFHGHTSVPLIIDIQGGEKDFVRRVPKEQRLS